MDGFRMGLARDKAFSFTTAPISMRWKGRALELVPFSPLETANCRRGWTGCIWAADCRYSRRYC